MNFWAKSWEGGSLNIESGSNAVFDTLGDLDKFIVKMVHMLLSEMKKE